MNVIIGQVQSICIFLLGLLTLTLIIFFPHRTGTVKVFNRARLFLIGGTSLTMIHFLIQYILLKNVEDIENVRTLTNLVFGIPCSYLFCCSMLLLQHRGELSKTEWLLVPILAVPASVLAAGTYLHAFTSVELQIKVIAVIYSVELVFNAVVLYHSHRRLVLSYKENNDSQIRYLILWMKWSTAIIVSVSLGYPIVIFSSNLLVRSLYGVASISSVFFYVFCFIGYGFSLKQQQKSGRSNENQNTIQLPKSEKTNELSASKLEEMMTGVRVFEEQKMYLKPELTIKEAAELMNVSVNMLRTWLRTTEYEKFNNWVTSLRIDYAKKLLKKNPSISSDELAEQCGFCDRQYFQKQFIKYEGQSPSKWIKNL